MRVNILKCGEMRGIREKCSEVNIHVMCTINPCLQGDTHGKDAEIQCTKSLQKKDKILD